MAPPAEKKQKVEEKDAEMAVEIAKKEEPAVETEKKEPAKAPEPPKELEEDARKAKDPITAKVEFLTPDTTLNVMRATVGNMLMTLSEGSLAQLVAGARANVGIKAGRYMFEAKIVEQTNSWGKNSNPVRVGFAAEGSLFLGEDDNSICFESDGSMINNKKRTKCSQPFGRDVIVAVVLNLDEKSPNFNTISLFRDGKRASQPQALPEELKGKTLFPSVSFKNCTLHTNFGAPAVPLPFKCQVVQEASAKQAVVTKYDEPADGKYTVLFPVSLPDEGTFDWLEQFLEKNPNYTELSDRAFANWAVKSGLPFNARKESNDKPGVSSLQDLANLKRTLMDLAAMQPRNFVIMEVKGNLLKDERQAALAKFKGGLFKTTAEVIVSETPSSFKKIVQVKTLKAKQENADREHRAKFVQEKREWMARKKTKDEKKAKAKREKEQKKKAEEMKKKAEEIAAATKKKAEEAKKKAEKDAARKKVVDEAKAKGEEPPAEEEEEEKEKEEEEKEKEEEKPAEVSDEEAEEPDEPEPQDTTPPTVSLTAEEKAVRFFKHTVPDLTPSALAASFAKFSAPESDEGFDSVKYSWSKEKEAAAYIKKWIFDKKQTTPVDNIVPSAWFKKKAASWSSESGMWKNKQNDYKNMLSKKTAAKKAKADRKAAAEKKAKMEAEKKEKEAEAKAKAAEAKAEAKAKAEAEGKTVPEEKEEEKKEEKKEEKAEEPAAKQVVEEDSEPEVEVDFDAVDVFGAQDILDVGEKVPLFRDFQFEDFAMMSLRFELNLLVHSFGKDCEDEDRKNMRTEHLAFYYQKYFGKSLPCASFGVKDPVELVALVNDTIALNEEHVMEALVPVDLESNGVFVKMTEAARRHRHLCVDMGDESAKLKITKQNENGGRQGGWKRAWKAEGGDGSQKKSRTQDGGNKGGGKVVGDKGKGKFGAFAQAAQAAAKGNAKFGPQKGSGKVGGDKGCGKFGGDKGSGKVGGEKGNGKFGGDKGCGKFGGDKGCGKFGGDKGPQPGSYVKGKFGFGKGKSKGKW